jgi:hypothetical protein
VIAIGTPAQVRALLAADVSTPPLTGAELDKQRAEFNDWYAGQPMPHLLARMDPQQAAFNAWQAAKARAQQESAAAIEVLARELVAGYPALLPTLYCDGKPVGKLLLDAVTSSFEDAAAKRPEPVGMVVKATFGDHKIIVPYGRLDEVEIGAKVFLAAPAAVAPSDATGKADAAIAGGLTPLDYRAQGREETLAIILAQSAEDPFSECIGYSHSGAPDDEGGCYWEEEKLRALLHIGDRTHDAYDRAEAAYWEALGRKDEAQREMLFVEQAPFYKPLHDFLRKHEAWDLMGDLKRAASQSPATSAADAKDAARYRWLRDKRSVLLLTGFFGNGCVNRYVHEVDATIDAAIAATQQGGK